MASRRMIESSNHAITSFLFRYKSFTIKFSFSGLPTKLYVFALVSPFSYLYYFGIVNSCQPIFQCFLAIHLRSTAAQAIRAVGHSQPLVFILKSTSSADVPDSRHLFPIRLVDDSAFLQRS